MAANDINDILEAIYQQLADLRGEALAGRVLASMAIQALLNRVPDPKKDLIAIEAAIDDIFDRLKQPNLDSDSDDLNEKAREVGRLRAIETIHGIRKARGW